MEDAGLPWTPAMEARQAGYGISNAAAAVALRTVTRYIADSTSIKNVALSGGDPNADLVASVHADQELAAAGVATKMDETEVISRGYWELTKYLADKVVASLPAGQKLFISGHSQGGTRASLVAMYLKKSTGVAYPTVSFAGTGASCMSRLLYYSNGHLLADVDPTDSHPNIMEYTHPLDPWGNSMLGEEVAGTTCYFGTTGLRNSDGAYKYCGRVYGYTGPTLIAASAGVIIPGGPIADAGHTNATYDFSRCRYFTHMAHAMLIQLEDPAVLSANGVTDGGCKPNTPIPANDPEDKCPVGGAFGPPSVPTPPSPPPPGETLVSAEYTSKLEMVIAGAVSDVTYDQKAAIARAICREVNVSTSQATVTVTAASVKVAVEVRHENQEAANAASAHLSNKLGSVSAANSFFSEAGVTVETVPTTTTADGTASTETEIDWGATMGIAVGIGAAFAGIVISAAMLYLTYKGVKCACTCACSACDKCCKCIKSCCGKIKRCLCCCCIKKKAPVAPVAAAKVAAAPKVEAAAVEPKDAAGTLDKAETEAKWAAPREDP